MAEKKNKGAKAPTKAQATTAYVEQPVAVSESYSEEVQPKKVKAVAEDAPWEIKDRVYVLTTRKTPIMMTLPVKHTQKRPLLYFDPEKQYERELRYATNQRSVFVDEQEGHITLQHVAIRNGSLFVPKEKQNLQRLLSLYHPLLDVLYREVDERKVAVDELEDMDLELEALNAAASMDIDLAEAIMRVEVGNAVSKLTTKELKRDLRLFAKSRPELFLSLANDENIAVRNIGIKAVEMGILALAEDQRTFEWKATGRKVMTVPFDENPYSALAAYFKTDDGIEIYQSIEKRLN